MSEQSIAFIGGGNMATSLLGGLLADGANPNTIWATDIDETKLASLHDQFKIHTTRDNLHVAAICDTLVLAVKPQIMEAVLSELGPAVAQHKPLVVSIAAGIRESSISGWLGHEAAVVRTMPNTPALVRSGATALFANTQVSADQRARAENILRAVGLTLWVEDEGLLDVVTALSGSGPAYFFLLMELLENIGTELGLSRDDARALTLQTAFGAAKMALTSENPPAVLRANVTSPGGTTERAINTLLDGDITDLVRTAVTAARDRSVELGGGQDNN